MSQNDIHIIPLNDEQEHIEREWCHCKPELEYFCPHTKQPYPDNNKIVAHSAFDNREIGETIEKWERSGDE